MRKRIPHSLIALCLFVVGLTLSSHSAVFAGVSNSAHFAPSWRFDLQPEPLTGVYDTNGFIVAALDFDVAPSDETAPANNKLSVMKAVGLSLLMPGAGQLYADRKGQARTFLGIEAGIWLSYAGLKFYADWRREDYIHFAQTHAGIDPNAKDDAFFAVITRYADREQYVTLGRALEPDDPFYPDTPTWQWSWDSDHSRERYRDLYNEQRSANRNAEFMFVAAAVNRLVSVVMAWRSVQKHNRTSEGLGDDLEFSQRNQADQSSNSFQLVPLGPRQGSDNGLSLQFSHKF